MTILHSILRDPAAGQGGGGDAGAGGGDKGQGSAAAAAAAGAGSGAGQGAAGAAGQGAAAAAPAPFYKGLYGDDGKLDKGALDRLPDHLKPYKDVYSKYDTIDALLNGFGNAHSMASKKGLTPLDANAPEHVRAERKALLDQANNVPKEAKGYGVAKPQDFPDEFWSQDGADKFAALAHKHSLSPEAVKELLGLQIEMTNGEITRGRDAETSFYRQQDERFVAEARKTGMDAERANELALRGASTLGIDPKSPIFKNADVRLACMRMTSLVAEDKIVNPDGGAGGGKPNPIADARDIINNPQNPWHKAFHDPSDPRNEEAKERVNNLYRMAGTVTR